MTPDAPRHKLLLPAAGLSLAVAIVFGQILFHPFVNWDDADLIQQNPLLRSFDVQTIKRIWSEPYLGLYTPLTYTLWSWVCAAWRIVSVEPVAPAWVFHAFSLALHILNTLLVLGIVRQVTGNQSASALLAAAVFGLHPIQVEAVAWASGTNNLTAAACGLAAILLYLRRTGRSSIAAALLFAAALMCKPTAVIVPLIILIIEIATNRPNVRRWAWVLGGWLVLAGAFSIITRAVQPASDVWLPPAWFRPVVALDTIVFYLFKIAFPIHYLVDYGRSPEWLFSSPARFLTPLVAAGIFAVLFFKSRKLFVAMLIFVAALLPTLGLQSFDFQKYSTPADRYAYLAMLGAAIAIGWVVRTRRACVLLLIVLSILSIRSVMQVWLWRDTLVIANHTASVNDQSLAAGKVIGATLAARGDDVGATRAYLAALKIRDEGDVRFNLANLLARQPETLPASLIHYQRAAELRPAEARILNNWGVALVNLGRLEEAVDKFAAAVQIDPTTPEWSRNLDRVRQMLRPQPAGGQHN